jgi:hypothetical protein
MDTDKRITDHFTLSEFTCKDGTPYPDQWINDRLTPLCQMLEVIRAACGGHSVTVLCGYRTPTYNEKLRHGFAKSGQTVSHRWCRLLPTPRVLSC